MSGKTRLSWRMEFARHLTPVRSSRQTRPAGSSGETSDALYKTLLRSRTPPSHIARG